MDLPRNAFKAALIEGRQQIGLWCTLTSAYATEVVAGAGYDWLLLDTEHSPAELTTVLAQLQAVSAYPVSPVVRPAANDAVLIKRLLDIGAQSLLIPYVQNAEEARAAVAATRYPPDGIRGVSALTRATRFGRVKNYAREAARELCLLVQVETQEALDQIEAIAAVEGVDGIFIGPGDLSASMGLLHQPTHPRVVEAIEDGLRRITAAGNRGGVLVVGDEALSRRYMAAGSVFTAVGVDAALFARSADALAKQYKA